MLQRPDKNSARGALADRIQAALGEYDPHDLIRSIAENEAFSQRAFQILNDPLRRKLCFPKRSDNPKFTPEYLEKNIPSVLNCCRKFVGGAPTFVCKKPLLCKFCGDSRARSYYRFYLSMAFGRLANAKQFNAMHGVIRHAVIPPSQLLEATVDLQGIVSDVRRRVREELYRARGSWEHAQLYDLYQFDAFMHLGARYNASGEANLFPHVHVVAQMRYSRMNAGILGAKLRNYSRDRGCTFAHTGTMKVRKSPNATAKHTVWDFASLGCYNSKMFKLDKMRPNYIQPLQRVMCLSALPRGFRQVSRRRDGQEVSSLFANTLPEGDAQAELPIGAKFWI